MESPERALWASVINLAIEDLTDHQYEDEIIYFFGSEWFREICGYLDLDPEKTIEAIKNKRGG